jgi:CBS domain-containing protein/PII-like signaling protein
VTNEPVASKRVTFLLRSRRSVKGGVIHLLETLKRMGASQATAFNAMASFTAQSPIRSNYQVDIMPELPVIVVWIDRAEVVERVLPQITPLIENGTVTVEDTTIVHQVSPEVEDLPKSLIVQDVMTRDVYSATPQTGLTDLVADLINRGLRSVPILDHERRVVGIVTNGDLVRRGGLAARLELLTSMQPEEREVHLSSLADTNLVAADIMTTAPLTVAESAPIREASRLMLDHHLKRLPVVDSDGRLSGMVSRVNLLRTVASPQVESAVNGALSKSEPSSAPIARLMTKDVPTVHEDAPVSHLVNVIISTRLNRAVVVDADQRPVGVVSDAELIERVTPEARPGLVSSLVRSLPLLHGSEETQELARHAHGKTAKDFMQEDYVQASRDEAIGAVLKQMLDRQKKIAVLVDEDGRLAGMVDRRDLLGALA